MMLGLVIVIQFIVIIMLILQLASVKVPQYKLDKSWKDGFTAGQWYEKGKAKTASVNRGR